VFIPTKNKNDRFTVRVRAKGRSPGATCAGATTTDCIQAARSVTYIPHSPLTVPIALDRACLDRSCNPGSTCVAGDCVPSDVSNVCRDGVCRPPTPDAGSCPHPWWNQPGPSALTWHFDSTSITDDLGHCGPATISTAPSMPGCGAAYADTNPNNLGTSLGCPSDPVASSMTFHLAFWVRVPPSVGPPLFLVQKTHNAMVSNGWAVMLRNNNELFFNGLVNGQASTASIATGLSPTWHAIEIIVTSGKLSGAYVDKNKVSVMPASIGDSLTGNVIVGTTGAAAIDELSIY
jgi:hypothetical protein